MRRTDRSDNTPHAIPAWRQPRGRWSVLLERLGLLIERPANRLIGSTELNPFYHTGTISIFLLAVVALTGFYLFLFYKYGFSASYVSVATRIETPILSRLMRAIHRYASSALVLTVLVHAWRMLFMERFRGPRWLAWLSGIAMTFVLWLAGLTGYWLVWDTRAQLINDSFLTFLRQATPFAPNYALAVTRAELDGSDWIIVFLILLAHVGLFLVVAVFYWLHIKRLKRPRWLPPAPWMVGAVLVLLVVAAIFPAGNLPAADFSRLPGPMRLDPVYLYYLPLNDTPWSGWLWAFMWTATAVAAALPFVRRRREEPLPPPVRVLDDKCTGCTKCAADCPYGALTMVERDDDSKFQLLALANQDRCVGCGICIGSCDEFNAITLGTVPPEHVWGAIETRLAQARGAQPDLPLKLIVTCQRHALHGAAPYLNGAVSDGQAVAVVPLSCTGAMPPHLLPRAVEAGAAEVAIVGCPPYDCANREGNQWEAQRVTHERVPRLRRRFDHAPITAAWLAPDDFAQAVPPTPVWTDDEGKPDYLGARGMFKWLTWRNLVVGGVLLGLILIAQVFFTGLPFTPYPAPPAVVQVTLGAPAAPLATGAPLPEWASGDPVALRLMVDGNVVWEQAYAAADFYSGELAPVYVQHTLTPGKHDVTLYWEDSVAGLRYALTDGPRELAAGEVMRLHDLRPPGDPALRPPDDAATREQSAESTFSFDR